MIRQYYNFYRKFNFETILFLAISSYNQNEEKRLSWWEGVAAIGGEGILKVIVRGS